jgi:hypothetical protein
MSMWPRMRTRLHLCIASNHVRLELLQPVRSTSARMAWRMLWAYLRGQDCAYYKVVGAEMVTGAINANTLQTTVQQALTQLERSSRKKLAGSALEVELGPMLGRVGLLELEGQAGGTGAPRLSAADLHAYAQAWVTHTWGLEPAEYVVRCNPLRQEHKYLLVCVDKFVPAQLAQLCLQQGIQFADCKPALVTALGHMHRRAAKSVMVLMENAPGARIAQWVVLDESGPLSVFRMWLCVEQKTQQDDEVTQMAHRLCAQHQFQGPADIHRHVWPLAAGVKAPDGTP